LAVAKANNLDLDVVETDTSKPTPEYLKYNKLSKVPTFVGADGYVLSECIAVAIYGMFEHVVTPARHIFHSGLAGACRCLVGIMMM
jgi:hypothetical protein